MENYREILKLKVIKDVLALFFALLYCCMAQASECGEFSIQKTFNNSTSVAIVKNIKLPRIVESKNNKTQVYQASFIVMFDYKGKLNAGDSVVAVADYSLPPHFSIGSEYILFMSESRSSKNEYLYDTCLSFDLSKEVVFVDSRSFSSGFSEYLSQFNEIVNSVD